VSSQLLRFPLSVMLAAELLANAAVIAGDPLDAPMVLLVALPLTVAAATLLLLAGSALPPAVRPRLARVAAPPVQAGALGGLAVWSVGFYASNRFLTDLPLGPKTRVGYGISFVAALLATAGLVRVLAQGRTGARLAKVPPWVVSLVTLGACGLLAVRVDGQVVPPGFPGLHIACVAIAALLFSGAAALVVRHVPRRSVVAMVAINAVLLGALGVLARDARGRLFSTRLPWTGAWQLVHQTQRALDRDGDRFSAVLGGDDCDDADPHAYPLSSVGRDCLGWVPAGAKPRPAFAPVVPDPAQGPGIIVFLTIDTFRCGFGTASELPELQDACPELTRLAAAGLARLDVHTRTPATEPTMQSIHLAGVPTEERPLAALLGQAGYRSHAIATHHVLLSNRHIRASFGTVDQSLVRPAAAPGAVTAGAVTDKALAWLGEGDATDRKLFLWAHYLDPHAPYAIEPGATFVLDQMAAYAAEVRRTDAEIGRLVRGLSSLRRAGEVLLVVTADHGEAFGLHRLDRHALELYETVVRVPFVTWSPGAVPRRFVTAPLPASLIEVRPFLLALLGGAPFTPRREQIFFTLFPEDPQVGILKDGWKLIRHLSPGYHELYHLAEDPLELRDLAALRPDQVERLGRALGAELARDPALAAVARPR
jgi:arylsulfatase A-like enzyme